MSTPLTENVHTWWTLCVTRNKQRECTLGELSIVSCLDFKIGRSVNLCPVPHILPSQRKFLLFQHEDTCMISNLGEFLLKLWVLPQSGQSAALCTEGILWQDRDATVSPENGKADMLCSWTLNASFPHSLWFAWWAPKQCWRIGKSLTLTPMVHHGELCSRLLSF